MHGSIDGDVLIVAGGLSGEMIIGREQSVRCGRIFQSFAYAQALPEFIRRRECFEMPLLASEKVELDNAMPIGRIGEFEIENRGIFLRLLQTVTY